MMGASSVARQGKPLPCPPYAFRHPEYWQKLKKEAGAMGDRAAARLLFYTSERLHPVQEEKKIEIDNRLRAALQAW